MPLDGADEVAEVTMVSQRLAGVPMETNGFVAVPGEGAGSPAGSPTRHPTPSTPSIAAQLGLEPDELRVVCPWVGGGFGPKAGPLRGALRAAAARRLRLGRPVKWAATPVGGHGLARPRPGLRDDRQARGEHATARSSASTPTWWPPPAPTRASAPSSPMLTQMMSSGVYDIPKVRFNAITVLTNTTTIGAYRGAGRPEATQLIERVLDVAADEIGMDPAEIRRKNFLQPTRSRSPR